MSATGVMDSRNSTSNRSVAGADGGRSGKRRLRFIINSPTVSEASSPTDTVMDTDSRESSGVLFRLPRQPTAERSGEERLQVLQDRLLHLWHRGVAGPPSNLQEILLRIEQEFQSQRPRGDDEVVSVATDLQDFDSASHNPIFYGKMYKNVDVDPNVMENFDPSVTHPSCVGYAFVDRPEKTPPPPPTPLPPKDTCSPRVYLEKYIFPTLLPALEEMLRAAKTEKCFERKRTKFNALDFLTEHLYSHNPNKTDREGIELAEIPFVKEHWKDHPRPPLPKSLLWTEEEAALIVQSHWRGFKIRVEPDIQELRQWQREWREENADIKEKVDDFWEKQMPQGDQPTPNVSDENLSNAGKEEETPAKSPAPPAEAEPEQTTETQEENSAPESQQEEAVTQEA